MYDPARRDGRREGSGRELGGETGRNCFLRLVFRVYTGSPVSIGLVSEITSIINIFSFFSCLCSLLCVLRHVFSFDSFVFSFLPLRLLSLLLLGLSFFLTSHGIKPLFRCDILFILLIRCVCFSASWSSLFHFLSVSSSFSLFCFFFVLALLLLRPSSLSSSSSSMSFFFFFAPCRPTSFLPLLSSSSPSFVRSFSFVLVLFAFFVPFFQHFVFFPFPQPFLSSCYFFGSLFSSWTPGSSQSPFLLSRFPFFFLLRPPLILLATRASSLALFHLPSSPLFSSLVPPLPPPSPPSRHIFLSFTPPLNFSRQALVSREFDRIQESKISFMERSVGWYGRSWC